MDDKKTWIAPILAGLFLLFVLVVGSQGDSPRASGGNLGASQTIPETTVVTTTTTTTLLPTTTEPVTVTTDVVFIDAPDQMEGWLRANQWNIRMLAYDTNDLEMVVASGDLSEIEQACYVLDGTAYVGQSFLPIPINAINDTWQQALNNFSTTTMMCLEGIVFDQGELVHHDPYLIEEALGYLELAKDDLASVEVAIDGLE